ncbi:MAG: endonuclease III [Thermoplasmata archaeon]|nr:endonuclease III [Thermoplasmata archaeon]
MEDVGKVIRLIREEMKKHGNILDEKWKKIDKNPFTVLISCLLSLRTKDEVTAEASVRLLTKYKSPEDLANAPLEEIEKLIFPVGFYRVKAKRIKEISKCIVEKFDGKVPDKFEELLKIDGIGRKTASVVMAYGFNKEGYIAVDTHCHRIPNRLGWIRTKTPEETERELKKIVPKEYWKELNHLFVRFGQTICLPISPKCSVCPVEKYCKKVGVKRHR